jgi:uncharacterized protein (TIGR02231 family)
MTQLETNISAVTVYPDHARLTRQGNVTLEPGLHSILISELPLQLNMDSVRAAARGTARARLLGVQVNSEFFSEAPAEQVRELEAQIESLQDQLRGIEAKTDLLQKQRANLDALASKANIYAMALASGQMSLEAHLAFLDGLRARTEALDAEMQALAINKRETERRLKKLQNELNQQRGARPRQRYTAAVELEVLQPGDLTVELSYVVNGAGWQPLYDLRLSEEGERPNLEVDYLAQVTQRTGEAWKDIRLILSTARPALAGEVPELDPWYVRPMPLPRPLPDYHTTGAAAPAMMRSKSLPDADSAGAVPEEAMVEAQVEAVMAKVEASGAAVSYQVIGKTSIPADGAPHKVTVARFSLPPQLDYVTAPSLIEAAYRRAKVTNDSDYLLLPGSANLFAGEDFIGATPLELTAPQGELELFLGVDDRIQVKRELKRRDVDKRLIGGKRRISYGYEICLENLLGKETRILLHDQIPVSRSEEIKVRLETADPRPAKQTELNLLDWEFTLAPKEKRTVRFDFTVEYPQGMEVIGLP